MQQLFIVFIGMFLAGYMVVNLLPEGMGFTDAIKVAAKMGKMNVIETKIAVTDPVWWKDKYNIWSGVIGGFFLALSYFGTDQSQVGRYLTAKSMKESRMGLLMNGLVKVPMQFGILLIGALVFVFYLNYSSPIVFNQKQIDKTLASQYGESFKENQKAYEILNQKKQVQVLELSAAIKSNDKSRIEKTELQLQATEQEAHLLRTKAKETIKKADILADTNDTNYIFLYFVVHHLPIGLIGLLIAMIFLSAWGSIAAALNSLASTSVIDIYKRLGKEEKTELHYYKASQWITLFWGIFSIAVAMFASKLGSLIEAVNILGSLFYGTILGIFMLAFYMKSIRANATFWAAVFTEICVIAIYVADIISFLWLNVIGCLLVMGVALIFQKMFIRKS